MKSRHFQTILRVSVFCGFLFVLSRMIDVDLLKHALLHLKGEVIGLALIIYFLNIAFRAYRLEVLLNKDGTRLTFREAYLITLIGVALNMFIPATMGDIGRSYYGYKMYGIKEEMLSATLVDKIFALSSLFLLGLISAAIMGYLWLGLASLTAAIVALLPLTFPRIIPWNLLNALLRRFQKSLDVEKLLHAFHLPLSLKFYIMVISILGWLCTCVFFYTVCRAFPVSVSLGYVIVIMPILTIVRLFPFTVNALGPAEVAVAYFFSLLGISSTLAVLISLFSNLLSNVIPGTLGFGAMMILGHKKKLPESQKSSKSTTSTEFH